MGIAMQRLSLGATFSTTYFESFHVARVFATLDLMTEGRAAWNIVTSMNDGEALNMGHTAHSEHDRRYDRADEFMEVVMGHRDAWDDGAIVADRTTGLFAHPEKSIAWTTKASSSSRVARSPSHGSDSGWSKRPRPTFRRALGRGRLNVLPPPAPGPTR
jgi:alkanesulfonate monooxygenase SsuD/methylene tetrahydromethanopterin reductase-like flavin-dependent oxidoreductase (luciferase family)